MERKELGKISRAEFGIGGYQDAMIGVTWGFGGDGWGVGDFWGQWATERTDSCKWTDSDRLKGLGETAMRLLGVLRAAKVDRVSQLKNIPVEVTFEGNALKSWRVLTEVL